MQNVTAEFEAAAGRAETWTERKVEQVLAALRLRLPISSVSWDPGDEQWADFGAGDGRASVCVRFPIVIATENLRGALTSLAADFDLTVIWVRDYGEACLAIDPTVVGHLFGKTLTSEINYKTLSAGDLWYATVT